MAGTATEFEKDWVKRLQGLAAEGGKKLYQDVVVERRMGRGLGVAATEQAATAEKSTESGEGEE